MEERIGLYLVEPHARLIWEGKKRLIVKSKAFENFLGKEVFFLDKNYCYGVLKITGIQKISLEDFKKLAKEHLISEEEREDWWKDKNVLYAYYFDIVEKFAEPKKVLVPKGAQTFIKNFLFEEELEETSSIKTRGSELEAHALSPVVIQLIKDVKTYDPSKLDDKVLLDDHRIVHAWFASLKAGKILKHPDGSEITVDEVKDLHERIVKEMEKRGFVHESPLAEVEAELSLPIYKGRISKRGKVIKLDDILKKWDSFKIYEDFIQIVGSIANWKETDGDIDILIKAEEGTEIWNLVVWRILRAYPEFAERFHFIEYKDWKGPFTNHVPLGDLEVKAPKKFEIHEMEEKEVKELAKKIPNFEESQEISRKENKIIIFRPFWQTKPTHGRQVGEFYNIENLKKVINALWPDWKKIGIFVEKKYDGTTAQLHKKGKEVRIYTEDGTDVTENLPTLVSQIREKPEDWVAIGELEWWKDGKHMPRAMTAGILNSKELRPEEKEIRMTLYDKLYHNEDIHELPFFERRKHLEQIKETPNLKISKPIFLVFNERDLEKAVGYVSKLEGSEGAMLKLANAPYELKPNTKNFIKFKNEYYLIAKVIAKYKVKGAEAWYYDCALKDAPYVGRTYNTSINAKVGDKLKVIFVDISEYKDPKTGQVWFNWWAPRVVEISDEPLSTKKEAHELVLKTTGRIEEKPLPKEGLPAEQEMEEEHNIVEMQENAEKEEDLVLTFLGTLGENIKPKKNHEKEASLLIEINGKKIMIDVGKSQEENLKEISPDYILLTHGHPDHVKGLEKGVSVPVFCTKNTLPFLEKYPLEDIRIIKENEEFELDGLKILPFPVWHSLIAPAIGYKITFKDKSIVYAPDMLTLPKGILNNVLLYIGDGSSPDGIVRRKGDKLFGHAPMKLQMKWKEKYNIRHIIFTHLGEWIHENNGRKYPLAKDNQIIRLSELSELSEKKEFVIQAHFRGASVHFDIRFRKNDVLEGFTMATAYEGKIKEPVLDMETAEKLLKRDDVWKIDLKTGKQKERKTIVGKEGEKIWCDFKAMQPVSWLKVEGWTPPRKIEPVPGGTKEYPGVFVIVDKGYYAKGADKPYFKEYFLYGQKWKGRIVFRVVAGMKAVKELLTWLYWKTDDQTPYVLSKRAVEEKWLPEGYSALPFELEKQVPEELNYWKEGLSKEERLKRRKALIDYFIEKAIIEMSMENSEKFVLTRRWWKGQEVIRKLPVEDWHIKFADFRFHLDKNPIYSDECSALEFKGENEYFKEGEYKPGSSINPNKKISAFIEKEDEGEFEIVRKTDNLIQVHFMGKKLKGMFIFLKTEKGGEIWALFRQKAPKTKKE